MVDTPATPLQFWETVAEHIRAKVEPVLLRGPRARAPIIAYLRDLEAMARSERQDPKAIHIIVSGRRILGDRTIIKPKKASADASHFLPTTAKQPSERGNAK